jgi:hypothetical protein
MSHEDHKLKHSKRIHDTETKIKKQVNIAKAYHMHQDGKWKYIEQPHRNHKKHILNCGEPHCYMCMNPRKADGEITIQEKRFNQIKLQET